MALSLQKLFSLPDKIALCVQSEWHLSKLLVHIVDKDQALTGKIWKVIKKAVTNPASIIRGKCLVATAHIKNSHKKLDISAAIIFFINGEFYNCYSELSCLH